MYCGEDLLCREANFTFSSMWKIIPSIISRDILKSQIISNACNSNSCKSLLFCLVKNIVIYLTPQLSWKYFFADSLPFIEIRFEFWLSLFLLISSLQWNTFEKHTHCTFFPSFIYILHALVCGSYLVSHLPYGMVCW